MLEKLATRLFFGMGMIVGPIIVLGRTSNWEYAGETLLLVLVTFICGWMERDYSARKLGVGGTATDGHNVELSGSRALSARPVPTPC